MVAVSGGGRPGRARGDAEGGTSPRAFRRWRRSRPFWGGLLLILAGLELLLIPLEDVLMRGAIGIVMHMGIGGVSGVLIGGVLATCGLLLWFDPAHRTFYAVIGVLGGVLSFPATNFGGFFLGLLLGIIGGSMAFGWRELSPEAGGSPEGPPGPDEPGSGTADLPGGVQAVEEGPGGGAPGDSGCHTMRSADVSNREAADRTPRRTRPANGSALLAISLLAPAAFSQLLLAGPAEASQVPAAAPTGSCILLVLCTPDPAPSPTGPGTPGPSPSAPGIPGLPGIPPVLPPVPGLPSLGGSIPSGIPLPGSSSGPVNGQKSPQVAGTPGLVAYTAPVVLSAGAVRVVGFAYQGVADLPVAGGGTVRMMKFTARSFTAFDGVKGVMTQGSHATLLTAPTLGLGGGVVLYAAKFSGKLLGVPVTLTPGNAESVLLQLLKSVTPAMPLTMTNVVADQPVMAADSLQGPLAMSAG